jgi:hypothetical protein
MSHWFLDQDRNRALTGGAFSLIAPVEHPLQGTGGKP